MNYIITITLCDRTDFITLEKKYVKHLSYDINISEKYNSNSICLELCGVISPIPDFNKGEDPLLKLAQWRMKNRSVDIHVIFLSKKMVARELIIFDTLIHEYNEQFEQKSDCISFYMKINQPEFGAYNYQKQRLFLIKTSSVIKKEQK